MAPRSLLPPRQAQAPRPAPRRKIATSLRRDDDKVTATTAAPGGGTRQVLAPAYWRHPLDDAHQWPAVPPRESGRSEVSTVNYSAVECPEDKIKQTVVVKKRPTLPCPCPDDIKPIARPKRSINADVKRITSFGDDDMDVTDQKGYCKMMYQKLNEVYFRSLGPLQQNLRGRILAEQTWFELQTKLFLPAPVTSQRTSIEVLHRLEQKRQYSARKERNIWKQVGRVFVPHTS